MSIPRFAIVLFPLFIGLALLLRRPWAFRAALLLGGAGCAGLTLLFCTWHFLG